MIRSLFSRNSSRFFHSFGTRSCFNRFVSPEEFRRILLTHRTEFHTLHQLLFGKNNNDDKKEDVENIYHPGDKTEGYIPTIEVNRLEFVKDFAQQEKEFGVIKQVNLDAYESEYEHVYEEVIDGQKKDRKIIHYLIIINVLIFLLFNIRFRIIHAIRVGALIDLRKRELGIKDESKLTEIERSYLESEKAEIRKKVMNEYLIPAYGRFLERWGLSIENVLWRPWTAITCTFIHTTPAHLFNNMLFLFIFGKRLRGRIRGMTWQKFTGLYIVGGMAGSFLSVLNRRFLFRETNDENIRFKPSVGASGSVYAVMAANMLYTFRSSQFLYHFFILRLLVFEVLHFVTQRQEAKNLKQGDHGKKVRLKSLVDHGAHLGGALFSVVFFLLDLLQFF